MLRGHAALLRPAGDERRQQQSADDGRGPAERPSRTDAADFVSGYCVNNIGASVTIGREL